MSQDQKENKDRDIEENPEKTPLENFLDEGYKALENEEFVWMVVEVIAYDNDPEMIINPKTNIENKLEYYKEAYDDALCLKKNPEIRITDYQFQKSLI